MLAEAVLGPWKPGQDFDEACWAVGLLSCLGPAGKVSSLNLEDAGVLRGKGQSDAVDLAAKKRQLPVQTLNPDLLSNMVRILKTAVFGTSALKYDLLEASKSPILRPKT